VTWESWQTVFSEETRESGAVASLPEDHSTSLAAPANRQAPPPRPLQGWSPAVHPEMGE